MKTKLTGLLLGIFAGSLFGWFCLLEKRERDFQKDQIKLLKRINTHDMEIRNLWAEIHTMQLQMHRK